MSRPDFAKAIGITEPNLKKLLSGSPLPKGGAWRIFLATGADPRELTKGKSMAFGKKSDFGPEDYLDHCAMHTARDLGKASDDLADWIEILLEASSLRGAPAASAVHAFLCQQLNEARRVFGLEDAIDSILAPRHHDRELKYDFKPKTYRQDLEWRQNKRNQLSGVRFSGKSLLEEHVGSVIAKWKEPALWCPGEKAPPKNSKT